MPWFDRWVTSSTAGELPVDASPQEVSFFDKEVTASGSLTAAVATFGASVSAILGLIWLELFASFVK